MNRSLTVLVILASLTACGPDSEEDAAQGQGVAASGKGASTSATSGSSDTPSYPVYKLYYKDADRDGYGNPAAVKKALTQPPGYVADNTDCDDGDKGVHPGATERCDDVDNDCDGLVDEGLKLDHYFQDADADGFGDALVQVDDCAAPAGFVEDDTDCDDSNPETFPGAPEQCDAEDNDCDGTVDEGLPTSTFFRDQDGDGWGDTSVTVDLCAAPAGYVDMDGDCHDGDPLVHPGAEERCNAQDDNCDGGSEYWGWHGSSWYFFCYLPEIVTDRDSAEAACEANAGMKLAKVTTADEHAFIDATWDTLKAATPILDNHVGMPEQVAWIGATDEGTEPNWYWADGSPLVAPTFWCPGEPNDAAPEGEDCAVTGWTANGYGSCADKWNDIPCDSEVAFICESGF